MITLDRWLTAAHAAGRDVPPSGHANITTPTRVAALLPGSYRVSGLADTILSSKITYDRRS